MPLHNQTRAELMRRVGNVAQLGGTRHYTLADGRSQGVRAVDVELGSGFRFTVLPDRGMDISRASVNGLNLAYLTPNGEVHPAYYEPEGLGWLRTFFGGLLTTCGLTYFGAPGSDQGVELGLHGRYATTPAERFCDRSRWEGDDYLVELSGTMAECSLFGDRVRLSRTITARLGERSLRIVDAAENFGYAPSPLTILYHVNVGFPLLSAAARLHVSRTSSEGINERSKAAAGAMLEFSDPVPGFEEQNFLHVAKADGNGDAWAAFVNPALAGGVGLYLRFGADGLPYLNEWKMMGEADYVVGVEPCNAPCANRASLRQKGLLPVLQPGESRTTRVEIGVLEGADEIGAMVERIGAINGT